MNHRIIKLNDEFYEVEGTDFAQIGQDTFTADEGHLEINKNYTVEHLSSLGFRGYNLFRVGKYVYALKQGLPLELGSLERGTYANGMETSRYQTGLLFRGESVRQVQQIVENYYYHLFYPKITEPQIYEYCLAQGKPYFGRYLEATLLHPLRAPYMFLLARMEVAQLARPVKFLEIGTWSGGSALVWAEAIKQAATAETQGGPHLILCIDPWKPYFDATLSPDHPDFHSNYKGMTAALEKDAVYGLFRHNLKSAGHEDLICSIRTRSDNILPLLGPEQFDLVYIDGKHDYDSVFKDITLSMPLIRDGGILCGADLEKSLVEINAEYAKANKRLDYVTEPQTDHSYHPGVTLAVGELLGEVSVWEGFWALRKVGQGWQKVELPDELPVSLPSYLKGFSGWSREEQQALINWLELQHPLELQQELQPSIDPQPILLAENYRGLGLNLIGYQNQVYAILQNEGAFSMERINNGGYSGFFVGASVAEVMQLIDNALVNK